MDKENKRKFALWIQPQTLKMVKKIYKDDNCNSQSEFIEKAVIFYCGYLSSEENKKYLPNILVSTLKGIVQESDNKTSRLLFKIAVELAMMMNVIAAVNRVENEDLEKLRGLCIEDVRRLNGSIKFDDAVRLQKG